MKKAGAKVVPGDILCNENTGDIYLVARWHDGTFVARPLHTDMDLEGLRHNFNGLVRYGPEEDVESCPTLENRGVGGVKTIWKYSFHVKDEFALQLPAGAEIVSVERQGDDVYVGTIWAIVDTDAAVWLRSFACRGTGHPLPENALHVASWQDPPFVWHLFEYKSPQEESNGG